MANFAVIENNTVVNVIIADTLEIAELVTQKQCVEYTDKKPAGIGWTYENDKFIAPPQPPIIEEEIEPTE
jgi:hypothetical protein